MRPVGAAVHLRAGTVNLRIVRWMVVGSVPAAFLGALVFGHVQFGLTASLIIGSVPAVLIGSLLSSTVPDRYVRPTIAFVIFASGLKYAGLGTTELGWTLCGVLLLAAAAWLVHARPWLRQSTSPRLDDVVVDPLEDEFVGDRES